MKIVALTDIKTADNIIEVTIEIGMEGYLNLLIKKDVVNEDVINFQRGKDSFLNIAVNVDINIKD